MRGYPQFSFWIPIALAKICFSHSHKLHQNTFCISRHRQIKSISRKYVNKLNNNNNARSGWGFGYGDEELTKESPTNRSDRKDRISAESGIAWNCKNFAKNS